MHEDKYSNIYKRLQSILQSVTLKLITLFLLVAVAVGGAVGYALYEYPPAGIKDPKTDKGCVWKVALVGAAAGLAAGFGAYYANLI